MLRGRGRDPTEEEARVPQVEISRTTHDTRLRVRG